MKKLWQEARRVVVAMDELREGAIGVQLGKRRSRPGEAGGYDCSLLNKTPLRHKRRL
jgi:hypothetical protein